MSYLPLGNPLWSCQLQILGGVRKLIYVAGIYGGLLLGASFLWIRAEGGALTSAVMEILRLLGAAQIGVLVLGGSGAISKALQRDYSTRMTDTLRTTPMSGWTVLAGYAVGACLQILTLFVVGAAVGALLIRLSGTGLSVSAWISGNLAVLLVGASVWSFVAFAGLGAGRPTNVTVLVVVLTVSAQFWLYVLPSLGLFIGAYAAVNSYSVMLNLMNVPDGYALELGVAGAMGTFWAWAAVRRYRKPWLPPLDPFAALILVGLATFCCMAAVMTSGRLLPPRWQPHNERETLFHVTALAPLLFLHLPTAMAVQLRRRLILGAPPESRCGTWPPWVWALLSAGVVILGAIGLEPVYGRWGLDFPWPLEQVGWRRWGPLALAYLFAACFSGALQKLAWLRSGRGAWATVATFTVWVAPPGLDILRLLASPPVSASGTEARVSWLFGCSPIGTALASLEEIREGLPVWPGLGVQAVLVFIALWMASRAERGLVTKRAQLKAMESRESAAGD